MPLTEFARIKILKQKLVYLFLDILQIFWKRFFWKKVNIWAVITYWVNNWRKTCEKSKKSQLFLKFISFHVHKSFWSSFSVNRSLMDDKDVHKGESDLQIIKFQLIWINTNIVIFIVFLTIFCLPSLSYDRVGKHFFNFLL